MDTINNGTAASNGNSPWGGTEGPGMTDAERASARLEALNTRRKQNPMAQMGHLILSSVLEKSKGYPKEFADFIGWAAVGIIPDLNKVPNWPGFEPKKD